jgi:hypothetical protein
LEVIAVDSEHDARIINSDMQDSQTSYSSIENEIADVFRHDPLYQLLNEEGKGDLLHPEKIFKQLKRRNLYSISQAAGILEKKDYHIRNNIQRNGLGEYVGITQTGKLYRVDYLGIYKLYLIFLLQEELRLNPVDIASIAGVMTEKVKDFEVKRVIKPSTSSHDESFSMQNFKQEMENQLIQLMLFAQLIEKKKEKKSVLEKAIAAVSEWEKDVKHLNQVIEMQENVISLARNAANKNDLTNWTDGVNKTLKEIFNVQAEEKSGFWSKLFGTKKSEYDYKEVHLHHNETEHINKLELELEKLTKEKEDILGRKDLIFKEKAEREKEYTEYVKFLEEQRTSLIESTNNPLIQTMLSQDNPAALLSSINSDSNHN